MAMLPGAIPETENVMLNLPFPCIDSGVQHLTCRANQSLKLSQRLMGLRPKVQGDGAGFAGGL